MISPHCSPAPVAVPGHCTLARDVMHTARYSIVPTLRLDAQILHLDQCTIQCASKVVATREESRSAMAESVTFDAALCDTCGSQVPYFFRFQHLMYMYILAPRYRFYILLWSTKAFPGRRT